MVSALMVKWENSYSFVSKKMYVLTLCNQSNDLLDWNKRHTNKLIHKFSIIPKKSSSLLSNYSWFLGWPSYDENIMNTLTQYKRKLYLYYLYYYSLIISKSTSTLSAHAAKKYLYLLNSKVVWLTSTVHTVSLILNLYVIYKKIVKQKNKS